MTTVVDELLYKMDADFSALKRELKAGEGAVEQSSQKISKSLEKSGKSVRENVADFEKWALKVGAAAAAAGAAFAAAKLVSVTREFDILNAQLITATGSAAGAAKAMEAIKDFAATTPFDLAQVTDSFGKLVNLGLTPSEQALRSYGDTASAMGKDMGQLIEAVADAATGEFERLKEFGIKASSEGDRVKFTFRGVTTEVGKNAAEIEQFLIGIGENNFAGAMEQRMMTLDGAISNLGDNVTNLFLSISQAGAGDLLADGVRSASEALQELTAMIQSGELLARLEAFSMKFGGLAEDAQRSFEIISSMMEEFSNYIGEQADATGISLEGAFENAPENIRAFIQLMTTELAAFIDRTAAYGTEMMENLKFWEDESFDLDARLAQIDSARQTSIEMIMAERDATIASVDTQISKADELRAKFDEMNAARAAEVAGTDRLAEFAIAKPPAADEGPTDEEIKAQEKAERELEKLMEQYKTEEELLMNKQARELELIALHEDQLTAMGADGAELRAKIVAENEKKISEIRRKEKASQIKQETDKWNLFAKAASMGFQAIFGESKTAQIALAGINTATGITQALASSPFPVNLANAAIVAANGAQQISQIRGASIGGGAGSGGGISGGASAAAAVPPPQAQGVGSSDDVLRQVVNVSLQGDSFGRDGVRDLLARVKEELRDGGDIGDIN